MTLIRSMMPLGCWLRRVLQIMFEGLPQRHFGLRRNFRYFSNKEIYAMVEKVRMGGVYAMADIVSDGE